FTTKCVVGIEAQPDRAALWLSKNPILVTALNPIIGYLKGAEVAKKAMAENKSVLEVVVELGYMRHDEAAKALEARAMTEGGIQEGGGGGGG
ncbi:MAG: aspartate ammonia-lyase, partial [Anaerolineae bacterium]|nr:aspartate ammonia-lyase [Anaerolineae bacterium]